MSVQMVLTAFGGVGLFLYGMVKMGEGLQKAAGDRMRRILEALTVNRFASVAVGMVVTAVIQSSAATTVMCVSFVNAGLMALDQAIGVIMGANIGTTITAQMVAFKLERTALPAIALGMLMRLLGKRKGVKGFADCLLGFGMLFLGITIVGDALEPLKSYEPFLNLMLLGRKNPLLGILVGAVFTTILQSSSAVTGLLVTMASRGIVSLGMAMPIILGANIGTTSTALISSIGTSLTARRTALAHLLFNLFGTLIFIPLLSPFENLAARTSLDISRQIANAHSIFNVSVTVLVLPLIPQFAAFVCSILKGDESVIEHGPKYLDARLISTPFMAVMQTKKEVVRMAKLCLENLETAVAIFRGDNTRDRRRFDDIEDIIDEIEEAVSYYVAKVSQHDVSDHQAKTLTSVINICADLERIGDHATSIVELADYSIEHNLPFSEEGTSELDEMVSKVMESVTIAVEALETGDKSKASGIVTMDDMLDEMERELRAKHIRRLNQGICYPASGVVYLDMLSHLERIGDHAVNIAEEVIAV
ncbi:MAG TPA: Na/Pi cotransporter family protein [Firmicutes bacterium]|nr:Na/Pi cotransporter family protein [Candidatus Fermentithermobacillaceae bacterium]